MVSVEIVNLKCGGCAKTITKALEKRGVRDVHVDVKSSTVSFTGDEEQAKRTLARIGYPEKGTEAAESLLKKATSYVSCARGKL